MDRHLFECGGRVGNAVDIGQNSWIPEKHVIIKQL